MSMIQQKKQLAVFQEFMKDKHVLIADPSNVARSSFANILVQMGLHMNAITLVNSYVEAEDEIEKKNPSIIISDYELGKRCGLDLMQRIRQKHPDLKKTLFVLVTANTSQSAVARAAEEDVDTYILKPFTPEVFRNTILKAVSGKVEPSDYLKTIDEGKAQLAETKLDDALKTFEKAAGLDSSPALAYFYTGQTNLIKQVLQQAEGGYNKGLSVNKIHYKCLVGLYDVMMTQKRHGEAYDVIKRISHYFPANPQRFTSVIRLAILTQSWEDIERYYRMFTSIDERNEEMIKYICAALVVCGKYYLKNALQSRALELFQKAGTTGIGRPKILREIIIALTNFSLYKEADGFLQRFPAELQSGVDYNACSLLVMNGTVSKGLVIDKGREMLTKGHQDPLIYQVMIQAYAEMGQTPKVEDTLSEAIKRWPDQKDLFTQLSKTPAKVAPKAETPKPAETKAKK